MKSETQVFEGYWLLAARFWILSKFYGKRVPGVYGDHKGIDNPECQISDILKKYHWMMWLQKSEDFFGRYEAKIRYSTGNIGKP